MWASLRLPLNQLELGSTMSHSDVKVGAQKTRSLTGLKNKGTNLGQPQLQESEGGHLREERDCGGGGGLKFCG